MKKKWILKGGLLALFSPLLSSSCFVTNTENPADPSNGTPPNGGGGSTNPGNGSIPGGGGTPDNGSRSGGGNEGGSGGNNKKPGGNNQARIVVWSDIFRDSISGEDILLHPTKEQIEKEDKRLDEEVKRILDKVKKENEEKNKAIIEKFEKEEKRLEEEVKKILEENKRNIEKIFKEFVENKWKDIFDNSPSGADAGSKGLYDYSGFNDKVLLKYKDWLLKKIKGYDDIIKARENYSALLRKQYEELADKLAKELEGKRQDIKKKLFENSAKLNYLENEKLVKARKELAETQESKKDLLELLEAAKEEKEYYANVDKVASVEMPKVKSIGEKIDKLEGKIKELQSKIDSISSQIKQKIELHNLISNVSERVNELKQQNKYLEERIKDKKQDDSFANSFVFNVENKFNHDLLKEWNLKIEQNNEETKELEEEIQRFLKDYENALSAIDKLVKDHESSNKEKDELDKQLVKLIVEVTSLTKGTKDWKSYLEQKEKEVAKAKENVALYENESKRLADLMKTGDSEESKGEKEVKESEADLVQLRKEQESLLKEQKALEEKEKVISVLISQSDKNEERFDRITFKYDVEKEKLIAELEKIEKILEQRKQRRYKEIFEYGSARETADLFSDEWLREIEKAKRNREMISRIYRDSKSGLDINLLSKDELEKWVEYFLDKNYKETKARFLEALAAKDTAALFDDKFSSEVADAKARAKIIATKKWEDLFNKKPLWDEITPTSLFGEYKERIDKYYKTELALFTKLEKENDEKIEKYKKERADYIEGLKKDLETDKSNLKKKKQGVDKYIEELNNLLASSNINSELSLAKETITELNDLLDGAKDELKFYVDKNSDFDEITLELESARENALFAGKNISELEKTLPKLESEKQELNKTYDKKISDTNVSLEEAKTKESKLNKPTKPLVDEIERDEKINAFIIYGASDESNFKKLEEAHKEKYRNYKQLLELEAEIEKLNKSLSDDQQAKQKAISKVEADIESKKNELNGYMEAKKFFVDEESRITKLLLEKNDEIGKIREYINLYNGDINKIETFIKEVTKKEMDLSKESDKINKEISKTKKESQRLEVIIRDTETRDKKINDLEKKYEQEIEKLEKEAHNKEKDIASRLVKLEKELKEFK
ncbi:hypothetical protein J8A71_03020 [Mycoplasmopsis agalactiae]|uniref:MAG6090-like repeat-containing lipoprotein n=1 Tax=Mycoplasmopsis agalactiae TaxID=2110 RepID=UPI001F2B3CC3|nr:hypothetical protein [Mycoplasmopsis agalactiae]MCE6061855.1 hypothetical protein [Mycoplasmopsis agalactiae]